MAILQLLLSRTLRRFSAWLFLLTSLSVAAFAQSQENSIPVAAAEPPASGTPAATVGQPPEGGAPATATAPPLQVGSPAANTGIILNPRAATGLSFYSGVLQQALGLSPDSALRVGGLLALGGNFLASGGVDPQRVSGNLSSGLGADVDMEKAVRIPGGEFYSSFAEIQGTNSNGEAGSIQLYDSLSPGVDFHRLELFELWYRQRLFDDRLFIKLGKINAPGEFNTVLNPVIIPETNMQDWAISNLLYVPVGENTTLFARLSGYPNPAWGLTATLLPTDNVYIAYGLFDGNGARGVQTGLNVGPEINSYKFNIGEVGYAWRLSDQGKPGRIAAGVWGQTGQLLTPNFTLEHGANGFYAFGSQRLWYQHPDHDPSGLIGFLQFGYTNAGANIATRYVGSGLTALGLVAGRPIDSISVGLAWSKLNPDATAGSFFFPGVPSTSTSLRPSEVMLQAAYQMPLIERTLILQAAYTAIPTPGQRPTIPWANVLSLQLAVIF
jgi:porin